MTDVIRSAAKQRVLVVDDEPTVREIVTTYLVRDGFVVAEAADGESALSEVERFMPDLVLLDVMLPALSGFDVLRSIRATSDIPVMLLSARTDEADRVLGLEFGADDYVIKPFSPREVTARVRAVLRRARSRTDLPDRPINDAVETFGALTIDRRARQVYVAGDEVSFTAKEFELMAFLTAHPRQVFSRSQLLEQVWDSSSDFQDPATVTVHVRRIRAKIEADLTRPRWIATVFGVGYRFEP